MTYRTQMEKISYILDDLAEIRDHYISSLHGKEDCQQIISKVIDLAKDIRHTADPIAAILEEERRYDKS